MERGEINFASGIMKIDIYQTMGSLFDDSSTYLIFIPTVGSRFIEPILQLQKPRLRELKLAPNLSAENGRQTAASYQKKHGFWYIRDPGNQALITTEELHLSKSLFPNTLCVCLADLWESSLMKSWPGHAIGTGFPIIVFLDLGKKGFCPGACPS